MTRDEAYQLLTKYIQNKNLLKHSFAAAACMKGIYKYLYSEKTSYSKATEDKWGITGLLHDMDYEVAQKQNKVDEHGTLSLVAEKDTFPPDILHGIQAHAYEYSHVMPESPMDWSIRACDQLTGLIIACAL